MGQSSCCSSRSSMIAQTSTVVVLPLPAAHDPRQHQQPHADQFGFTGLPAGFIDSTHHLRFFDSIAPSMPPPTYMHDMNGADDDAGFETDSEVDWDMDSPTGTVVQCGSATSAADLYNQLFPVSGALTSSNNNLSMNNNNNSNSNGNGAFATTTATNPAAVDEYSRKSDVLMSTGGWSRSSHGSPQMTLSRFSHLFLALSHSADETTPFPRQESTSSAGTARRESSASSCGGGHDSTTGNATTAVGEYSIMGVLGRGPYTTCRVALDPYTHVPYVAKTVACLTPDGAAELCDYVHSTLIPLRHPNIVRVVDAVCADEANDMHIVHELVPGGHLARFNNQQSTCMSTNDSWDSLTQDSDVAVTARFVSQFRDVLHGLEYLHCHGIVHMHIVAENIMVADDGVCKLADFGCWSMFSSVASVLKGWNRVCSSPGAATDSISKAQDIYDLGVVMQEMVSAKASPPPDAVLAEVLAWMTHETPSMRPSASEVLGHAFFNPRGCHRLDVAVKLRKMEMNRLCSDIVSSCSEDDLYKNIGES
eukprot:PhM_4_TR17430/c1_g1_i2/m.25284/K07359/CAMKK2; calcium/calmodulin-dependent protein kinase kinase 2